ncbi:hypothetical protein HHK36_031804 [Tetracentron sinense]|uniref:Uncharacterized protein n=1 Tax=Tetracentron sinense TaxID=13715 RepID=A0A834Y921_TETSI|nr:hypothetical protein HHK36_031804 [Tetracentron sinense]
MLKADDNSTFWLGSDFSFPDDSDALSIDIDSFIAILESPDPLLDHSRSSPEDLSCKNVLQGEPAPDVVNHEDSHCQIGIQEKEGAPSVRVDLLGSPIWYPSDYSELLHSRTGMGSECLFESPGNCGMVFDHGKLETSAQISSPVHSCSLTDWMPLDHDICSRDRVGVSEMVPSYRSIDSEELQYHQLPNCSTIFSFAAGDTNYASDRTDYASLIHFKGETEDEFMHVGGDHLSNCDSHCTTMENSDLIYGKFSALSESSMVDLGALERNSFASPMEASFIDADTSLHNAAHTELNCDQGSDIIHEASDHCSALPFCTLSSISAENAFLVDSFREFLPDTINLPFMSSSEEKAIRVKGELEELPPWNVCSTSKFNLRAQEGRTGISVPEVPMMGYTGINDCQGTNFKCEVSNFLSPISRNSSSNAADDIADNAPRHFLPGVQSLNSSNKQLVRVKDDRDDDMLEPKSMYYHSEEINEAISTNSDPGADDGPFADKASRQSLHGIQSFTSSKKQVVRVKDEREDALLASKSTCHSVKVIDEAATRNPTVTDYRLSADHSSKQLLPGIHSFSSSKKQIVCIKDEREDKLLPPRSMGCDPLKVTGEAVESNPSWNSFHVDDDADICILEDISDPVHPSLSLLHGKSLITSQRSAVSDPPHLTEMGGTRLKSNDERLAYRAALQGLSQPKSEASPPDGVLAVPLLRHQRIALSWMVQKETTSLHCSGGILADDQANKERKCFILAKGRPAAGTLVVCPTSVLRQWAEELHNKVTSKANLSVLVYHGSNRTKDPSELAKYDVVLTTYAIVSMEVPKQPLVDKDDVEKGKPEAHGLPLMEFSSSRKRKYPPSSVRKSLKGKKGMDGALLDSVARPLARVGWFRVVLDEAQSIKNHRTQVARACWGLRAKRRYDPYAVYKSFCSMVKVPINRNPTNGYKKLQAVLKTIMLRRTKGTLLDGSRLLTYHQKRVELKKVVFSKEERDFYNRLEADSRAQFKVYAAAVLFGDPPIEMARKLPQEKTIGSLECLEALAICGICNTAIDNWNSEIAVCLIDLISLNLCAEEFVIKDPPEDAVVPICRSRILQPTCICEHLTGDDNVCPNRTANVHLSLNFCVFQSHIKKLSFGPALVMIVPRQFCSPNLLDTEHCVRGYIIVISSKIKAALEVCNHYLSLEIVLRMIVSLRSKDEIAGSASLGLNMVAACHVLLLDLWWNPTTEDQAIDRAHRIGQTRPCKEESVSTLQRKERWLQSAFGEDETGSRQTRLTVDDLKYLFMV